MDKKQKNSLNNKKLKMGKCMKYTTSYKNMHHYYC